MRSPFTAIPRARRRRIPVDDAGKPARQIVPVFDARHRNFALPPQRVAILRGADRSPVSEVAEKHAVSEQTIDNGRQHFGTMERVDTTGLRAAVGGAIDARLCVADVWQGCAGAGGDASAVGSVPALRVSAHPRLPGTSGVPDGSRPSVASTAHEAKVVIEQWRRHYNEVRPHSSLTYRTPNEFVQQGCSSVRSGGRSLRMMGPKKRGRSAR